MNRLRLSPCLRAASLLAVLLIPRVGLATQIDAVPVQTIVHTVSGIYHVQVDDGAGNNVTQVQVNKQWVTTGGTTHTNVYYAHFSFGNGSARVTVTLDNAASNFTYTLSPQSYGIQSVKGTSPSTVTFTLTKSRYLMLKVDDPAYTPYYLIIIADALDTAPSLSDPSVFNLANYTSANDYSIAVQDKVQLAIGDASTYVAQHPGSTATVYVPSGAYKIAAPMILASNVNVYLAAGAVLRAATPYSAWPTGNPAYFFRGSSLNSIKIYGRGTIDCAGVNFSGNGTANNGAHLVAALKATDCTNLTLDGIVLREASTWTTFVDRANGFHATNVKVMNYAQDVANYRENDGIELIQCQNSDVTHCLVFTADDACCMKGGSSSSDTPLQSVNNCTFSDVVCYSRETALKFGLQAYAPVTNSFFKDIDIVHCMRALGLNAWTSSTNWNNLGFLDVRCEDVGTGETPTSTSFRRPIEFTLKKGYGSNQGYAHVTNVAVTKFTCTNFGGDHSVIQGISDAGGTGTIDGVAFADLSIGGVNCLNTNAAQIDTNPQATNITFAQDTNLVLSHTFTYSTNWTGTSVAGINDGLTASEAQTNDLLDAWVSFDFVSNRTFDRARVYKDNGTFSAASWKMERWDATVHAWVVVFDFTACPEDGFNQVLFPPVVGTAVRLTFHPNSGGKVGINEVEVYGH